MTADEKKGYQEHRLLHLLVFKVAGIAGNPYHPKHPRQRLLQVSWGGRIFKSSDPSHQHFLNFASPNFQIRLVRVFVIVVLSWSDQIPQGNFFHSYLRTPHSFGLLCFSASFE
jgi:hypothetical protein